MPKVNIKALSVNKAWRGRRFKTDDYKLYERVVLLTLPKLSVPDGKLAVSITFGLSSKNADVDNPAKCFIDCLQKKYGFNDSKIYELLLCKVDVKKGDEFIDFRIDSYVDTPF